MIVLDLRKEWSVVFSNIREMRAGADPVSPRARVVISGWTASGKSTLADHFAATCGLMQIRSSDFLLANLGAQNEPRGRRLLSWLASEGSGPSRSTREDRRTDLWTWRALTSVRVAAVMESVALPLLLPPANSILTIRLEASETVRAERLRLLVGGIGQREAHLVLRRKDSTTHESLRAAWGIDLTADDAVRWRSDVVLRCPDTSGCSNPRECVRVTRELAVAAYRVYRHYLQASSPCVGAEHVRRLGSLVANDPSRVMRMAPLLLDAGGPFTVARWGERLLTGVDDMPERRPIRREAKKC